MFIAHDMEVRRIELFEGDALFPSPGRGVLWDEEILIYNTRVHHSCAEDANSLTIKNVSPNTNVLICYGCFLRIPFPASVKTWQQFAEWADKKRVR